MDDELRKFCRHRDCQQDNPQPVANFHRSKVNTSDYLQSYCKKCVSMTHRMDYVPIRERDEPKVEHHPFWDTEIYRNLSAVETCAGMARVAACRVAGELVLTAGRKPKDRVEYEWSRSVIRLLDQVLNHVQWLNSTGTSRFSTDKEKETGHE